MQFEVVHDGVTVSGALVGVVVAVIEDEVVQYFELVVDGLEVISGV